MHFFYVGQEVDKKSQLFIELKCFKLGKGETFTKNSRSCRSCLSVSVHIEYDFYVGFYSSNLARNYFNSSRRVT